MLLSAAEGITWVVVVLGFFVWSMPYQLPPPCYRQFFLNILNLSIYWSIYLSIHLALFLLSIYHQHLPFPKYQYIITADPWAGIGPCYQRNTQLNRSRKLGHFVCVLQRPLNKQHYWNHLIFSLMLLLGKTLFYT